MITCDRSAKRHYGDEAEPFRRWSVSQVCDVVSGGCDYYTPGSSDRGQDIHDIFALAVGHSIGLCEAPDVPTEYAGYHRGILEFIEKKKPRPLAHGIERCLKHATLPYAGRTDFMGMIAEDFGVLDLKTGLPEKWHRVQVHGYQKMTDKAAKMWILYIGHEGGIDLKTVKYNPRDWATFQCGLSILQWREAA